MDNVTRNGRPRARVVWPLLAAAAWIGSVVWVAGQIGIGGVITGLVLSTVITVVIVAAFLWLSRWQRTRPSLLVSAFVWGAAIAPFGAIWSQKWLESLVTAAMGPDATAWIGPLISTPVTEEVLKGLFLVWLLVSRRREITGVLSAIVFAGIVGAGFTFTENILYLGRAVTVFSAGDTADVAAIAMLAATFFLRVVMLPFFHPLMVMLFGVGIGIGANARGRGTRILAPLVGLLAAIILHGAWDWAGLASADPFLIYRIYGAVLVPVFLAVAIAAVVLRHRTGRAIAAGAPMLVHDGDLDAAEVEVLTSLRARRQERARVRRRSGGAAARATARHQAEASALAIRASRGQAGDDAVIADQRRVVAAARSARNAARSAVGSAG